MSNVQIANEAGITAAVAALRRGQLIGLPTETVYGLAADITHDAALSEIFRVKGRPSNHPLIVHIADIAQLDDVASYVSPACRALVDHCWPGPLTVVVPAAPHVSRVATGGLDTVAVRLPSSRAAQEVIARLGNAVAAPSANRFGHVSPTTAQHVAHDLGDDVAIVLDDGPCELGVESTIVDCTKEQPEILRPGSITPEAVRRILAAAKIELASGVSGPSRASGMLARHYAPLATLVLHEQQAIVPQDGSPVVDCATDPITAAHDLYANLRHLDALGHRVVHVIMPRAEGVGFALRDRLKKAATAL